MVGTATGGRTGRGESKRGFRSSRTHRRVLVAPAFIDVPVSRGRCGVNDRPVIGRGLVGRRADAIEAGSGERFELLANRTDQEPAFRSAFQSSATDETST